MTQPLVIIGGGGMGRCVLDLIDVVNHEALMGLGPDFDVVGVLDDGNPDTDLLAARGVKFLGPVSLLEEMPADVGYLIGIGSTGAKRTIGEALAKTGRPSPVLVHTNVHRGHDVQLSSGVVVASHVSMENHIRVGRHVWINQNSTIGHDTVIGDHCTISPLAAVSGNVTMEDSVFVGTGATINQGLTLGYGCTVGAGAAVIRDVPAGTTVVGVPATPIRG